MGDDEAAGQHTQGAGLTRRLASLSTALLVALAALAFLCAGAQAHVVHKYLDTPITEVSASSGAKVTGPLTDVHTLTPDAGKLWIAESTKPGLGRVDEFDESGAFVRQLNESAGVEEFGNRVAPREVSGKTEVYVAAVNYTGGVAVFEGEVAVFDGASGALLGTWTGSDIEPQGADTDPVKSFGENVYGVEVDSSANEADWAKGDVYVSTNVPERGSEKHPVVDVFRPEASGKETYVTQITGVSPTGAAFLPTSAAEPFTNIGNIVVDQANGDLLIAVSSADGKNEVVDVLAPVGVGEYELAHRLIGPPHGTFHIIGNLATNGANGEIYVADSNQGEEFIYEFSGEGEYEGRVTGTPMHPSSFDILRGIAVDPTSGHLFVGEQSPETNVGVIREFGADEVQPDVETLAASPVAAHHVTLQGTVNPKEAGEVTSCRFVWGTSEAFGNSVPCSVATIPNGKEPVTVEAEISGLSPDTAYYYRLEAGNGQGEGLNEGEPFQDQVVTTAGPGMVGQSTASVTSESASLQAQVIPHGRPTYYYFQYGTSTEYGTDVPAPGEAAPRGALVGSGEGEVNVSQPVQFLTPNTPYHYRVVVESEVEPGVFEAEEGPDHTFTTQPAVVSPALPDGRQWELVSPPDKHGALIKPISEGLVQASETGSAFTYLTDVPTEAEPAGNANVVQVLSSRGGGGWSSQDIDTPHAQSAGITTGHGFEYRSFSPDLSHALLEPEGPFTPLERGGVSEETPPRASERTAYMRSDATCASSPGTCYTPLLTTTDITSGAAVGGTRARNETAFVGATPDLSHVVLASELQLTSTTLAGGGREALYEWSAGMLRLVSVLPEGEGGGTSKAALGFSSSVGGGVDARNAVSSDGSRVFWSHEYESGLALGLYMWDAASGRSIRLDVPVGKAGNGASDAEFQAASDDGSRVFFTDTQELVPGAHGRDLYLCEIVPAGESFSCDLRDLAQGVTGLLPGVSGDGAVVYYVAGTDLYVAGASEGWTPRLIAALSIADRPDWGSFGGYGLQG